MVKALRRVPWVPLVWLYTILAFLGLITNRDPGGVADIAIGLLGFALLVCAFVARR